MKRIPFFMAIVVASSSWAAGSKTNYQVSEPPQEKRVITLKLLHPRAAVNPVRSYRVDRMTVRQVVSLLLKNRGAFENAALDCQGGYNPLASQGLDFLSFDIASVSNGLLEPFASMDPERKVHDLCMIKAYALADRLTHEAASK